MPLYTLEFQIHIQTSAKKVYEHLTDPHHFVGLQPLLTHVDSVQFGERDGCKTVSYETVEAFRWRGITLYNNRIRVQTVFTHPPKKLNTVVESFPNVTLNVEFTFTPKNNGVLVKQIMQINTYAWLSKFVISEATRAQNALLVNLKNRLES